MICERMGRPFEQATTDVDERPAQNTAYVIDSTRARTELSWQPQVSLGDGLAEVVVWVEQYWDGTVNQPLEYQHKP